MRSLRRGASPAGAAGVPRPAAGTRVHTCARGGWRGGGRARPRVCVPCHTRACLPACPARQSSPAAWDERLRPAVCVHARSRAPSPPASAWRCCADPQTRPSGGARTRGLCHTWSSAHTGTYTDTQYTYLCITSRFRSHLLCFVTCFLLSRAI